MLIWGWPAIWAKQGTPASRNRAARVIRFVRMMRVLLVRSLVWRTSEERRDRVILQGFSQISTYSIMYTA
jgi:hypothetical protein